MPYPVFRWSLLALLLAMLALLTLRTIAGPIPGLISARTTLNFSALAFLALIALAFLNGRPPQSGSSENRRWIALALAGIVATTSLAYLTSVTAPFLFDDYTHLTIAARETLPALVQRVLLGHPSGGDLFFRPLGSLYYWFLFRLSGANPIPWHLANVTLHVLDTLLVYRIARRLAVPATPAILASAFFAWAGVHVEDVCWVAAAFDLFATLFVLLALLDCLRPRAGIGVVIFSVLACLSKESAYCLPLLVLCVGFFHTGSDRMRIFRRAIPVSAACGVVFTYRLWYVRGLGGYHNAAGQSQALSLHPISTLQALLLRIWGVGFFSVNWSQSPEWWLKMAAVAFLLCAGCIGFLVRKGNLTPAILFILCAALPVVPLLLIGPDLSGARVLYLPSVGISLLWGQIGGTLKERTLCLVAAGVLVFQLAALRHNETIWVHVAQTASYACIDTANLLKRNPGKVVAARDLPKTLDGVFFLQNGFPQCVAINGAVDASRIRTTAPLDASSLEVHWDAATQKLQPH